MIIYVNLLALLLCFHFLCDFALQNDYVARAKNRNDELGKGKIWMIVLSAHSAIHALPVFLLGLVLFGIGSELALAMLLFQFCTHFLIDFSKCENKISYHVDQLLHLLVMLIISGVYGYQFSKVWLPIFNQ